MLLPGIILLASSVLGRARTVGSTSRITPMTAVLPGGGFAGVGFSM